MVGSVLVVGGGVIAATGAYYLSRAGGAGTVPHPREVGPGLLHESFDMGAERYDGDRLPELEPALKPGLAGGWLYRSDAHLRPDRLMSSWRRVLEARGVTVRERCAMTGLVREDGRARAVVT